MSSLSSTSGPGSGPGSAQAPELISLSSIPRESIEFAERMQQMRGGGYMDSDEEEDEMYAPMRTSKEVDDSYAKYTWNWYRSQYKLPSKAPETQAVDDFRDLRIKNQHASSSGVGSQDFHTYRWLRRKERFRLQIMDQAEKEKEEEEKFQETMQELYEKNLAKTAKRRAKREKRKGKRKQQKKVEGHVASSVEGKDSGHEQSSSDDEECDQRNRNEEKASQGSSSGVDSGDRS